MIGFHARGAAISLLSLSLLACASEDAGPGIDAASDAAGDVTGLDVAADATDTSLDAGADVASGAVCPPVELELGNALAVGDCVEPRADQTGVLSSVTIRPDCTDAAIGALADKRHLVVVPETVTQDVLWLHLGGSGGQPTNTENIGEAAAREGYRYISLAYPNEPSISERCQCPDGPRPATCEGEVRAEILYGVEATETFEMQPDEAIVPRLAALLRFLDAEQPGSDWSEYLNVDGQPDWERIAVSGFSQGGGMAGLIARDHVVARALYFSKGAGGSLGDTSNAVACTADVDCDGGRCCAVGDLVCDEIPESGGQCLTIVPSPWARAGEDVNGDYIGDGGPETRATPPDRQFALVHREEGAWGYSPDVFALWGMGTRDDFFDADTRDEIPAGTRLFSTGLAPRNNCSEHQSMGADGCQPRDPQTGFPAMMPVWRYAMSAPVAQ